MFQQLPMYQQVGSKAYKVDLSNINKLVQHLKNPHQQFKTIHVAGTNGKGSVSHMLASVLQEAGYKVGLYTSPHLKDFRERIRINGGMIPEDTVTAFIRNNKNFFEQENLSFFEMTVGMAFQFFAEEEVDIAVVEVGLGGRLDSTNIISPEVSVITNIGFDHMAILGNTLPEIAAEKGGIIKPEIPVVIGEYQEETFPVFKKLAEANKAPLHLAEDFSGRKLTSDLKGHYQKKNIRTVSTAIHVLKNNGWNINPEAEEKGLQNVIFNTGLRGRWEILGESPKIICDTAHNKEGLVYALKQLQEEEYDQLHLVIGVVNDKDLDAVLPLYPKSAKYYFSKPNVPRGQEAEILQKKAGENGLFGEAFNSVSEAYEAAISQASERDVIYVGGSTFTVAEII
ncbi:bifunctional folylpolyglutamate synthase/dihydrofolate synthase [Salinimicrobium xinjiangense]|uniref:bifunctional folylpolyglutamate synthase/dihydrofolate synthase n=1 Tax=Salinimicrobium xinjiangense TaxID=438596 RepID=UPI000A05099C|nr:folylpolyglutamate synthase/dihydrofolate synthase family protein [Salinimicrobium xinjiangense]